MLPLQAMRELVAKCLVKDPTKRPTAAQLLDNKFFKTAHDSLYLQKHLLAGLPSVPERVQMMRQGQVRAGGECCGGGGCSRVQWE